MKLIADAGSTKTEWALIGSDGSVRRFESPGVNALMMSAEELCAAFTSALAGICVPLDSVAYYGAGCVSPEVCAKVASALPGAASVEVASDLVGAARGLLGHGRGLVAIFGTGSNCGLYDGSRIVDNMAPLGYILGDEGSGTAIGRRILREVYRFGRCREEFERWSGLDYGAVLERVYRRPGANAFLASLVAFLDVAGRRDLAREAFEEFFGAAAAYFAPAERTLAAAGGLAAAFAPELELAAASRGFTISKIQKRPMEGLINYHSHGK